MNSRLYLNLGDGLSCTRSTSCWHFHYICLVRLHSCNCIGKMSVEFVDSVLGIRKLVLKIVNLVLQFCCLSLGCRQSIL